MAPRAVLALLLALFCACGASVPSTRKELDEARLAYAQKLETPRRAPELWANVERARREAAEMPAEDPAHEELISEARLWLEAAIAECERADLATTRLAVEREIEELDRIALRATRALQQATQEAELQAAASIAKEEATRALERAATLPVRRPKLDKADVSRAATALITRTRLVLTAAKALGAESDLTDKLSARLDEAEGARAKSPDAALDMADRALFDGLALLGQRRAHGEAPRPGEAKELAAVLEQAGFHVQRGDTGLVAHVSEPFARALLSHLATRKLARLCALSQLHTVGALRVQVATNAQKLREARVREVNEALIEAGCTSSRFGLDAVAGADALDVVWLSY